MGIVWLDAGCDISPSKAHDLTSIHPVDGGDVYCCKYCWRVKWLPNSMETTQQLTKLMTKYGNNIGYLKLLDRRHEAKMLIYQLQELWVLRGQLDRDELQAVIDMSIKEVSSGYSGCNM